MCELVEVTTNVAGRGRAVRKGTVVCADDPRIKGASHIRPLAVQHYCGGGPVEQMTGAPGEKRDVKLPSDRPPKSGPGSGIEAWREYAAKMTNSPVESWSTLSRDEIIELLDSETGGRA